MLGEWNCEETAKLAPREKQQCIRQKLPFVHAVCSPICLFALVQAFFRYWIPEYLLLSVLGQHLVLYRNTSPICFPLLQHKTLSVQPVSSLPYPIFSDLACETGTAPPVTLFRICTFSHFWPFFGVVNPMQARFFSFFRHTSRGFFRAILDPRYLPIDRYSGKGNCLLISVVFTG